MAAAHVLMWSACFSVGFPPPVECRPCVWHHCGGHASETKLRLPFFLPLLGFGHAGGISLFLAKLFFDDDWR